jgi:hypothetical protein
MTAFLRFLAGCLLLVAVIAAVDDVTRSQAAGRTVVSSASEHWQRVSPASVDNARSAVQRRSHPLVWDYGVAQILRVPTWGLFGLLGLLLGYAGRRRRRVDIFAN